MLTVRRYNRQHRFLYKTFFVSVSNRKVNSIYSSRCVHVATTTRRFRHCFRMSPSKFDFLLSKVSICLNSVVLKSIQCSSCIINTEIVSTHRMPVARDKFHWLLLALLASDKLEHMFNFSCEHSFGPCVA